MLYYCRMSNSSTLSNKKFSELEIDKSLLDAIENGEGFKHMTTVQVTSRSKLTLTPNSTPTLSEETPNFFNLSNFLENI